MQMNTVIYKETLDRMLNLVQCVCLALYIIFCLRKEKNKNKNKLDSQISLRTSYRR